MNSLCPLFITHWFSHHSAVSGYDQLARCWPDSGHTLEFQSDTHGNRGIRGRVTALPHSVYRKSADAFRFYQAAKHSVPKANLVHVLYGEIDLPLANFGAHLPVIATIHQPPSHLTRTTQRLGYLRRQLTHVDVVIALSQDQAAFFRDILGSKHVRLVPHGVDTAFFQPSSGSRKRVVLMVGGWLRDWDSAARVLSKLAQMDTQVRVRLVNPASDNPVIQSFPAERLHITPRLSDDELLREYQSCGVVYFPLRASTANNALLEACACGCRVVAPALGGVPEYAPSSACLYDSNADTETIAAMLIQQLDRTQATPTDAEAVAHMAAYNWSTITTRMANVYHDAILKTDA